MDRAAEFHDPHAKIGEWAVADGIQEAFWPALKRSSRDEHQAMIGRDQGLRDGTTTEERDRLKAPEGENHALRQAMRSCARRPYILPRRRSTARSGDDSVYRRSSRDLWGRADLPGAAECPVDLPRPCCGRGGPRQSVGPGPTPGAPRPQTTRVRDGILKVYGARKVWRQLRREGTDAARRAGARLMGYSKAP